MPHKPSILVVDDSTDGREMLVEYLTFRGFDVAEARDGEEAISVAREKHPTVILMDLTMPGLDGWQATRRIKAIPDMARTTIVALTAHAFPPEEASARAAGCDAFVPKPYDLTALADALAAFGTEGLAALDRQALAAKALKRARTKTI